MQTLNIGTEKAAEKIKHFCAFQERCHQETSAKLFSFGLRPAEVNALLAMLIEENYVSEERFAIAYAGGKFRVNKWGKIKIKIALRQKQVSEYCIKQALGQITDIDYLSQLDKLAKKKIAELKKEENSLLKKNKVLQYLVQKGYEQPFVYDCIKNNFVD